MSDETQNETPYEPDHPDSRYDNTGQRQKQRYTETITRDETSPSELEGGTGIDPDGAVEPGEEEGT